VDVIEIPFPSKEFVYVRNIRAFAADAPDSATDPTTLTVRAAVTNVHNEPTEADWQPATWANSTDVRFLFSPTDLELKVDNYYLVWLDVEGSSEEPARPIVYVKIT
jgi:hypothetical protein